MTARTRIWAGITVAAMVVASVYVAGCLSRQAGDTTSLVTEAQAQSGPPRDNVIDGTLYPQGYTPMAIKNGNYPRAYYPNTEKLGPKEMRVTARGGGLAPTYPQRIRRGLEARLVRLQAAWSQLDKTSADAHGQD